MEPGRAFCREAGRGAAVVCIHSSASSSAQWRPLMDRLAGRFRMLAVDLYGSGKSPMWSADRPLSLADEAAQLAPVFAAAGERFHVIGHSYGGAVALAAALAEPGRVESLVLFEPVLFSVLIAEDPTQPAAREIAAVRDDTVAALECGNPRASGARFVDYWMGAGSWAAMPEPRREALATAMSKVKAEWDAAFREPTPLSAFAALDVPVLYITGSDSPASARGVARLLTKTLPRVTTVEIEGVGHMGPVTHPDRVNALIERYLTDGPATPTEQTRRNGHGKCDPDEHSLGGDAEAFRGPGSGLRPGQSVL
jgi:pimeloyl-ACP methyl ester carboxylesterase